MSEVTGTATKQSTAPEPSPKNELRIQRSCDCGQHTPGGHECGDCKKRRATPPRWTAARAVREDLSGESTPGTNLSQVPAHTTTSSLPAVTNPSHLVVDDDVTELQPGQLSKGDFLNQLRIAVQTEAEAALAGTERSTVGCPQLTFWFSYYQHQNADHIENTLRRYAPETRDAQSAAEYIPAVAARVRLGVERWVRTGEVTGVPEEVPSPAATRSGVAVDAAQREDQGSDTVQLKARHSTDHPANDPAEVQERLGSGQPLPSHVRSRMEQAFGQNFADVRTHTDPTGNQLSSEQNARAFTVGDHIAFAAGEHRPGTPLGDALIAHELAHVVQQSDTGASTREAGAGTKALEEDADQSAVAVVTRLWGDAMSGPVSTTRSTVPRARSGLRLSRCKKDSNVGSPASLSGLTVVNSVPATTFPVPSSAGASGRKHWVTPERAGGADPVVEAGTTPAGSGPAGLRWEINGAPAAASGTPNQVSVPRSRGKKVVRAVLGGASSELTIWSVAAQITPSGNPAVSVNTTPTRFTAGASVNFTASILPVEVITDPDHPDLSGANLASPPDNGSQICGKSLARGADHKWDISRRTRQNVINPAHLTPTPASDACLWSNLAYPTNGAEGNDDTHAGDETNDPYTGGGALTSADTPSDFILHTDGRDGNTFEIRAHFQEFARLELDRKWWQISEHSPWRFHIKTRKDAGNHRWVDDGTTAALDNAGF